MFRNMKYIYCVYRERSFSKAADKLFIAQSSLSATIKKAEEKIGAPIFNRNTTPISLTPFGVEYIEAIKQIFDIEDRLRNNIYDLQNLQSGSLAIGGSNFGISSIVPKTIARFKKAYPRINLTLVEMNTLQSKHMLDAGDLDLIITNRPLDINEYERTFCFREQLILAVPKEYPINEQFADKQLTPEECGNGIFNVPESRCVSLSSFEKTPFILLNNGNYLRLCTDMLFAECATTPDIVLEVEQSAVSYNFARLGLGATIFSNYLIEDSPKSSNLAFYKIDSKYSTRETFVCYRKGHYVTFAMKRFIEIITREWQDNYEEDQRNLLASE